MRCAQPSLRFRACRRLGCAQRTPALRAAAAGSAAACRSRCAAGAATNSISRGYLKGAMVAFTWSCSALTMARRPAWPGLSTQKALTIMPRSSSGLPITPHSATAGMLQQRILHLRAADVVAGGDDHVVGARLVEEVAVRVLHEGVARVVPAVLHVVGLARRRPGTCSRSGRSRPACRWCRAALRCPRRPPPWPCSPAPPCRWRRAAPRRRPRR